MRLLLALAVSAALAVGVYVAADESGPSPPAPISGGWEVAAADAEGVDAGRLRRAVQRIQEEDGSVLALLVARNGKLVLERYFHGYDAGYPFDVYSITKSVTSAVAGEQLCSWSSVP